MRPSPLIAFLVLVCGPGCGGGSSSPPAAPLMTLIMNITSTPLLTGSVIDTMSADPDVPPFVGDSLFDVGIRGFYSFDISGLPAGAVIVSATLTTAQRPISAGTPYADLGGALVVDHVDLAGVLDLADYGSVPFSAAFGVLSGDAVAEVKVIAVTAQVAAEVAAARTTSEYRLSFAVETDSGGDVDVVDLENAAGSLGTVPTLSITYAVP